MTERMPTVARLTAAYLTDMHGDAETLVNSPLFHGLDRAVVSAVLSVGRPRSFGVVEVLMRQGDTATCMHLVLRGRLRVVRHTEDMRTLVLAELGPGEGVGEIGLIDGEPRTATVVALEPTETLEIDAQAFTKLSRTFPEFYERLVRVLSRRLRATQTALEREQRPGDAIASAPELPVPRPSGQSPEANKALVARSRELIIQQDWTALAQIASWECVEAMRADSRHDAGAKTRIREVVAEADWVVELTTVVREDEEGSSLNGALSREGRGFPVVFAYRIEAKKIVERIHVAGAA